MSQVYGCIECGMLFAGWEFCLSHIEHCRPEHYLEVDKETLKEMCMIGHPHCLVPSYQPPGLLMNCSANSSQDNESDNGNENDNDNHSNNSEVSKMQEFRMDHDEDDGDDEDDDDNSDHNAPDLSHFFSEDSSSDEEESVDETMETQDFLNPVENRSRYQVAAAVEWEHQQKQQQKAMEEQQDEMVMDLFSPEEKESILQAMQQNMTASSKTPTPSSTRSSHRPPLPILVTPTNDAVANSRTPQNNTDNSNSVQKKAAEKIKRRLQKVEHCLLELIQEAPPIASEDQPQMVMLDMLPKVYQLHFGTKLDYQAMGFVTLKALLRAIPSVTVVKSSPYFGIEHEYVRCASTTSAKSLLSTDEDDEDDDDYESDEDESQDGEAQLGKPDTDCVKDEDSISNQKTPLHTNYLHKPFSFNSVQSDRISSTSEESLELQPMSAQPSDASRASNEKMKETATAKSEAFFQASAEDDEESLSNSTTSSCGSSRSAIITLAEILPSTNAFSDITRVMAKYPQGVSIGQLLQQAPEFKNFLSHCTDRRCEAQIKLAHNILQQCKQIAHTRASVETILYFQATDKSAKKPLSIITKSSSPQSKATTSTESSSYSESLSMSIEERAAKLFASSEFMTPTGSLSSPTHTNSCNDALSPGPDPPSSPFRFRRPPRLDTISSPSLMTPTGSRSSSPLAQRAHSWANPPRTPPRPRTRSPRSAMPSPMTPAKELAIAESAARILAEAQSMTTPRPSFTGTSSPEVSPLPTASSSPKPFLIPEEAMKTIERYTQEESSQVTRQSENEKNKLDYRPDGRLFFFTDEMATAQDEASFGTLDRAASSMTAATEHTEPTKNKIKLTETSSTPKSAPEEEKRATAEPEVKSRPKEAVKKPKKETPSKDEVVDKLALDLFPTTRMHHKLLVALAEHPHGMTWNEIHTCIPGFAAFVEKYATENGIQDLHARTVLQSCLSIRRKEKRGSELYLINAPKMTSSESKGSHTSEHDEASVTSGMTESSTMSAMFSHQEQLTLELAFEGSDISATVCFLRMLKQNFKDRPWPSTRSQINQFLTRSLGLKSDSSDMLSFHEWFDSSVGGTVLSSSRRMDRAVDTLVNQMQRLNCVSCESLVDLSWDSRIIDGILEHMVTIWKPSNQDCGRQNVTMKYVKTVSQLETVKESASFFRRQSENQVQTPVSVSCIGTKNELHLILVGTETETYIFDCVKLGPHAVCSMLTDFFTDNGILKVFHDLHWSASALRNIGEIHQPLRGVFDVQLAMESLMGDPSMSFDYMVRQFGFAPRQTTLQENCSFGKRPLPENVVSSALDHIDLLCRTQKALSGILQKDVHSKQIWKSIKSASVVRAAMSMEQHGKRQVCLDSAHGNALASLELLKAERPGDMLANMPLVAVSNESGQKVLVTGAASMILDLLDADPTKSILFLGEPGSGKTTLLRDAARVLAERTSVSILDINSESSSTSDHGRPHSSVGKARRYVVDKAEEQSNGMAQCARNHKPNVMVMDELERASDVESAMMCKRRSVRLLASTVVGSLRELVADPYISGLVGGGTGCSKMKPIFDVVVELRRGALNEFRVITDTAEAVDAILQGASCPVQLRTRDPVTGSVQMQYEQI